MKKNVKSYVILPLIAIAGSLASCGPKTEEKGIVIDFWHTFGDKPEAALQDKVDQFVKLVKENEGVDVTVNLSYQGAYKDVPNKVNNGMRDGELPTMVIAYADHVANYMEFENGNAGKYVVNLDTYINDEKVGFGKERYLGDMNSSSESGKCDKEDIVRTFFEEGQHYKYEGTYSLPWMKSSEIMFYNLDAAKRCFDIGGRTGETFDASVKNEEDVIDFIEHMSWEEMMNLSRFAMDHKANILPDMMCPVMYDSDSNFFISKMYQEEIPFASIGDDGVGHIDFESGEARQKAEALLTEYAQNVRDNLLTTKILQEGKYSSDFFTKEQVMFAIGSSGGTGYNSPQAAAFKYGISKVPASNNNPLYITQGPTLTLINNPSDSAKDQEAKALYAWKFMKYLTNTDINTELCIADSQGYIPMRESSYQSEDFAAFLEEGTIYAKAADVLLNDISGNYIVDASFKGSADLRSQVGNIIASIIGGDSISDAFTNAINEAKKFF